MNIIMHSWISFLYYILVIAGIVSTVARKQMQSSNFNCCGNLVFGLCKSLKTVKYVELILELKQRRILWV